MFHRSELDRLLRNAWKRGRDPKSLVVILSAMVAILIYQSFLKEFVLRAADKVLDLVRVLLASTYALQIVGSLALLCTVILLARLGVIRKCPPLIVFCVVLFLLVGLLRRDAREDSVSDEKAIIIDQAEVDHRTIGLDGSRRLQVSISRDAPVDLRFHTVGFHEPDTVYVLFAIGSLCVVAAEAAVTDNKGRAKGTVPPIVNDEGEAVMSLVWLDERPFKKEMPCVEILAEAVRSQEISLVDVSGGRLSPTPQQRVDSEFVVVQLAAS